MKQSKSDINKITVIGLRGVFEGLGLWTYVLMYVTLVCRDVSLVYTALLHTIYNFEPFEVLLIIL